MKAFERVLRAVVNVLVLVCVVPALAPALLGRATWLPRAADVVRRHPAYADLADALPRALRRVLGLALDLAARPPCYALLLCALHALAETLGALAYPPLLRTAAFARLRTRAVVLAAVPALFALARTAAPASSALAQVAHSFVGAYTVGACPALHPALAPSPSPALSADPFPDAGYAGAGNAAVAVDMCAVAGLALPAAVFFAESLLFPHSPATRGLLCETLAPVADAGVRAGVWLGEAVAAAQLAAVRRGASAQQTAAVVGGLVARLAALLPPSAVVLAGAVGGAALAATLLRRIPEALFVSCANAVPEFA